MILRPYKRIKELEESLSAVKELCEMLEGEKEERLRKKREGMHNPNALCEGCDNVIKKNYGYLCKLDCKCEDRKE